MHQQYVRKPLDISAKPHINYLIKDWYANPDHFPYLISKDRWPPNSPDSCPSDDSLWNELPESMDWKNITTKATLIDEIECSVIKIEKGKI